MSNPLRCACPSTLAPTSPGTGRRPPWVGSPPERRCALRTPRDRRVRVQHQHDVLAPASGSSWRGLVEPPTLARRCRPSRRLARSGRSARVVRAVVATHDAPSPAGLPAERGQVRPSTTCSSAPGSRVHDHGGHGLGLLRSRYGPLPERSMSRARLREAGCRGHRRVHWIRSRAARRSPSPRPSGIRRPDSLCSRGPEADHDPGTRHGDLHVDRQERCCGVDCDCRSSEMSGPDRLRASRPSHKHRSASNARPELPRRPSDPRSRASHAPRPGDPPYPFLKDVPPTRFRACSRSARSRWGPRCWSRSCRTAWSGSA